MARVIAIDGPSGAGKSSVSRRVGERLGFLHVDSGALYRIMTWQCLENGVDTSVPDAVAAFAGKVKIECVPEAGRIQYLVKGEEPGIRFDLTRQGVVHVSGLSDSDRLTVVSLDGKQVKPAVSLNGSEATVDLTGQPRGCYIVRVNKRFSFKLLKP